NRADAVWRQISFRQPPADARHVAGPQIHPQRSLRNRPLLQPQEPQHRPFRGRQSPRMARQRQNDVAASRTVHGGRSAAAGGSPTAAGVVFHLLESPPSPARFASEGLVVPRFLAVSRTLALRVLAALASPPIVLSDS